MIVNIRASVLFFNGVQILTAKMVIASDFESLSYKSLFLRFGRQFLLFIIGILIASGIMYGIERNYSTSWYDEEVGQQDEYYHYVEHFLNSTGSEVLKNFTRIHKVDEKVTRQFIHLLHKLAYQGDGTVEDAWYNYHTDGLTFLQAFALIISTVTTVGKV